ncbi:TIGR03087 family PEP-CTERM/XrtA system glycosyltransferase [Arsukibacterium perlucidum]|uniref:TIGR03087 family PEP-CTERM/XrtA system glycosyltransferase n=1 Tax=Arsukibacterium perlucidum TaxID=368811 RepID=UPI00036B05E9|nr:TIGR03087 family PEP-CTERM/XrtA system glycosyltransferase [Arsukibacterium perlucidum]
MSQRKPALLLLVHRIPYPPNKGDKIRSFNLMKSLSKQYDIHLGCFYDDPFDQQYIPELKQWCKSVCCLKLGKWQAMLRGLTGFLTNKAITMPYYFRPAMRSWVKKTVNDQQITKVLVYSSSMAQYVDAAKYQDLARVIDFVDIDSDKWRQYAEKSSGLKRWFYHREARLLQQYETTICQRFNASLFVSDDEAKAFRQLLPLELQHRVHSILNGVDTDFFNPEQPIEASALPEHFIVFTGAMDYWANVDAVCWFCQNIWPQIKQQHPQLHFLIVGGKPDSKVNALTRHAGVVVSGRVKDIRPYIVNARFVVAPMLIARGIQNKVLEAMAMNKVVVCTSMAMEGINAPAGPGAIIADDAESFGQACLSLLQQPPAPCANRQWILENFTWQQTLATLPQFIAEEAATDSQP